MLKNSFFLMLMILGIGLSGVSAQTETVSRPISAGVVNGKAISLPKPEYPAAARAVNAEGSVNIQVLIDEQGNVESANAVSGHPLLRQAAEEAARGAKFRPTLLSGQPVKVNGVIVYNFVGPGGANWNTTGFIIGTAETRGFQKIRLPEEFAAEEKQFDIIGGLSPAEQTAQIANTVALIKAKLKPADLWRFEFGLAKGRIMSNLENQSTVLANLAKFRELALNQPDGVQSFEINRAVSLAAFADKTSLTSEDKEAILGLLR